MSVLVSHISHIILSLAIVLEGAENSFFKNRVSAETKARQLLAKASEGYDYLRFLYRCIPSISSALVKPDSISLAASSGVLAVLHVYSSLSLNVISCV